MKERTARSSDVMAALGAGLICALIEHSCEFCSKHIVFRTDGSRPARFDRPPGSGHDAAKIGGCWIYLAGSWGEGQGLFVETDRPQDSVGGNADQCARTAGPTGYTA